MLRTAMHAELANFHSSQLRIEPDVIDQDQSVIASRDIQTMDILASNAHRDSLLMQTTTETVYQLHHVLEITNTLVLVMLQTAMHAELAHFHLSQLRIELVATDQDQLAHVLRDTVKMDTHASTAQITPSLIETTTSNVFQLHAQDQTKSMETVTTATDVKLAHKTTSQTPSEDHASDQRLFAVAHRDTQMMSTAASNAQRDLLLIQETQRTVSQLNANNKTHILVPEKDAMNAKFAKLTTLLTLKELVAIDQDQPVTASRDTLKTDILASNAQIDLLLTQETKIDVSQPQLALETINILDLVMPETAMHAEPANFHSFQLKTDKDAIDQDQSATASRDTLMMAMSASNAQIDMLLTQEITRPVFQPHHAKLPTNILDSVMLETAMHAEPVLFHSSQLKTELDAIDQDQLAAASKDTVKMVMLANNAQTDSLLTQETTETVSQLHHALQAINISVLVMLKTAMLVEHANFHSSQLRTELDVIDQDQLATVSKDTQMMDMNASNAQSDSLLTQETTRPVSQLTPVEALTNILVTSTTAMLVEHAHFHSSQERTEAHAIDQDQLAHALKDTAKMVTHALTAQPVKLLIIKILDVFQLHYAQVQVKFLVLLKTVTDVDLAHFHRFQTNSEDHATDQSLFATATKDTLKMNILACHAQLDMLLTQETRKPVSQLPAETETQSSVMSADVTNAKTAQLDIKPTPLKPDVIESSQLAHVPKSMTQLVTNACHAQLTKLQLITTRDVCQLNAQNQLTFLVTPRTATNAAHAHQDLNQIT